MEALRDIRWGWGGGGWGDVNVPWKHYVTYAGVGVGGWGDVNVPWKRYVTYAGVGVGGGVMLTFLGSVT